MYIATRLSKQHANTNGNGIANTNENEKNCEIYYIQEIPIEVIVFKNGSLLSSDSADEIFAISSNGYSSFDDSPRTGNAHIVIQSGTFDSDTLLISVTTWRNTGEKIQFQLKDGGTLCQLINLVLTKAVPDSMMKSNNPYSKNERSGKFGEQCKKVMHNALFEVNHLRNPGGNVNIAAVIDVLYSLGLACNKSNQLCYTNENVKSKYW